MSQPIIVPLDRSPFGEEALPIAVEVAGRTGAPIHLIMVHVPPRLIATTDQVVMVPPGEDEATRYAEEDYLRVVTERLMLTPRLTVLPVVLEGPIEATIANYVRGHDGRMVVMSTHGRGGVSRFFLGSVADRLVRELHCPVLLVRPGHMQAQSESHGDRQVLIPLDGSTVAESTIDRVVEIFGRDKIVLHLMQVVAMPLTIQPFDTAPADQPLVIDRVVEGAESYLDRVAVRLRNLGLTVETVVRVDEVVASVVFSYLEEKSPDLIALATRGEGGLSRAVFGSVADKLIRGSTVPVLAWNPPEGAASSILTTGRMNA